MKNERETENDNPSLQLPMLYARYRKDYFQKLVEDMERLSKSNLDEERM